MLIAVWIITCLIIVGFGVYSGTRIKGSDQWSGGDRQLSAFDIAFIFGGWQIGGMAIVGAAQNGYKLGISGAWYSIAGSFYFIFLAFFAKQLREKMPGISIPAYLRERFGVRSSKLYSYAWVVYGFFYIPLQLLTLGSIIRIAIPFISAPLAMFIGLTISVVYTSFSGMKGAATVGRIVSIGIYTFMVGFVVYNIPKFGGYKEIMATLPAEFSSMTNMPTQRIIAWLIGGCLSTAFMQSVLQPLLSAKSPEAARRGSIVGYFIAAPISVFAALIGIFALVSNVDLGDGSTAFAWSVSQYSNPIIAGMIFGFATLIISATISTMMLATGTVITDIYKTDINPSADDKKILKVSKVATFVFAYLTLIPTLLLPTDSINNLFVTLQHVAAAPVSFSILSGLFWEGATREGSFWSMLSGIVVGLAWMLLGLTDKIEAIYPVVIVSYGVGIIVSLMTKNKKSNLKTA